MILVFRNAIYAFGKKSEIVQEGNSLTITDVIEGPFTVESTSIEGNPLMYPHNVSFEFFNSFDAEHVMKHLQWAINYEVIFMSLVYTAQRTESFDIVSRKFYTI